MAGAAVYSIQVQGLRRLTGALKALGEVDAPYLHAAMQEIGPMAARAVAGRAPGAIAGTVRYGGVKGSGGNVRALVVVSHPGSKPMEFGDYYGHRGQKNGRSHPYPKGQRAKPFIGLVKGGQSVGEIQPRVKDLIDSAIEKEWEQLGSEGSGD